MLHSTVTGNLSLFRAPGLKRFSFFGALLLLTLYGVGSYAFASDMLSLENIQSTPSYDKELSFDQFKEQSRLVEGDPARDPALAFTIRLPDGWELAEGFDSEMKEGIKHQSNKRVLGTVARYFSPPRMDFNSFLEVKSMRLDNDISARNWFLDYILSQGFTLQGLEQITETRHEALYNLVEDGVPYVVRTLAEMNGPRIILVSYYLPELYWATERAFQQHVIESFSLKNPEPVKIEKKLTYSFLQLLKFDYPVSWKLRAPYIESIDVLEAEIINTPDNTTLDGTIKLTVVSTEMDTTLADEIGFVKEDLKKLGFTIGELIDTPQDYQFHDHIFFHRVEAYTTDSSKGIRDHELWLAIMVEDRYYYIVTMLTPSRKGAFLTWARNIEAFEVVIESLRP